jgi:hypothetical protein
MQGVCVRGLPWESWIGFSEDDGKEAVDQRVEDNAFHLASPCY